MEIEKYIKYERRAQLNDSLNNKISKKIYNLINFPKYINSNAITIFDTIHQLRKTFKHNNSGIEDLGKLNTSVEYESILEQKILIKLSKLNFVKQIKTQSLVIKYEYENTIYDYYHDVQLLTINDRLVIIEIKPLYNMMDKRVIAKYQYLKRFCEENGFGYLMIDDRNNSFDSACCTVVDKEIENRFIDFVRAKRKLSYLDYKIFKEKMVLH